MHDDSCSKPHKISEILNNHFRSVFSTPTHDKVVHDYKTFFNNSPTVPDSTDLQNLNNISISSEHIKYACRELSYDSVAGPDVLGPVLFLIMMSDISQNLTTNIVCFADDTRLFNLIDSQNDCSLFQSDLKKIPNWASSNNMIFNDSKFSHISYSYGKQSSKNKYFNPSQNLLFNCESTKDLGITVNEDLHLSKHIHTISRKSRQLSG